MSDGPDSNMLRRLFGMLPSYAAAIRDRRVGGKGKPFSVTQPPQRICTICGKAHEHKVKVEDLETFSLNCGECQALLEQGYTALRSADHRYAFVRHPELEAGKVVTLSIAVMNQVKERFDAQRNKPDA